MLCALVRAVWSQGCPKDLQVADHYAASVFRSKADAAYGPTIERDRHPASRVRSVSRVPLADSGPRVA